MKGRKIIMVKSEIKTYGYNTSKYFPKNSRDITDGKEIDGYDVKIITGWKSDGTPISVMRDISPDELDPLIPYGYNSSDGFHWSDVDSDGIPDIVESMLSNASYFLAFYNFTHKDDWLSAEREKLWDDYNWTISYYFSLKLHKNYDKIYSDIESNPEYYIKHYNSLSPHNESCGENATKYLTSQFNPFVVENMPPVIVKFDVNFTYYGVTAKMQVYAVVRDAGAIKKVKLIDSDLGQSVEWNNIHKRVIYISHTFLATPWGANLGANITIKTWDMRDDYAKMSHVVYGPEGVLIKMFLDWLAPFLRVLGEAWKAAQSAANFIAQWIIGFIKDAFNRFVSVLQDIASGYSGEILNVMEGRENIANTALVTNGKIFVYSIIGLIIGLGVFMAVFSGGFSNAASVVSKVIGKEFIDTIISSIDKINKRLLLSFLLGAIGRIFIEWFAQQENMSESDKKGLLTTIDVVMAIGGTILGILGDDDLKNLVIGYALFIFGVIANELIDIYGKMNGWSNETIKLVIVGVQSIILLYLLWLTIKSILTFTISDGLGGIFGYIDEFILGFFFTSSLITFGETVWDLLLEFLRILPRRATDVQGVVF